MYEWSRKKNESVEEWEKRLNELTLELIRRDEHEDEDDYYNQLSPYDHTVLW